MGHTAFCFLIADFHRKRYSIDVGGIRGFAVAQCVQQGLPLWGLGGERIGQIGYIDIRQGFLQRQPEIPVVDGLRRGVEHQIADAVRQPVGQQSGADGGDRACQQERCNGRSADRTLYDAAVMLPPCGWIAVERSVDPAADPASGYSGMLPQRKGEQLLLFCCAQFVKQVMDTHGRFPPFPAARAAVHVRATDAP